MKHLGKFFSLFGEMERPVKWSLVFHVVIVIAVTIGIPHCIEKREVEPLPIIVDLVAPREMTAAPNKNVPKPKPKSEPKKDKPKPAPKSEPEKQAKKPTPKKPEKKPEPKPQPKKAEPKPEKAPPKKPSDVKDMIEKLAKQEPEKEQPRPEPEKDFSSILKNLADSKAEPSKATPESRTVIEQDNKAPAGWAPTISETLSISQLDMLQHQLAGCWSIPAGAMDAQNLIIDIAVEVNPDRTVRTVEIMDKARYNRDTFFRAAAESAKRAVLNPDCSPLALPPEKYDLWKSMTIQFNPRTMFGE